jgi:gliding motility-associated-like protein
VKKRFPYFLLLLLSVLSQSASAQGDIIAMEYFIDIDPGVGAGIPVPITNGAIITETFTIATSALPTGFHTAYFRIQDLGGQWSMSESRSFFVGSSNLIAQANIVDIKYFIDIDPGYGGGTSLGPFATPTLTTNQTIATSALLEGFHVFYTRALDSDGVWGNTESRPFYISASDITTQSTIIDVEYFIDIDPGFGAATSLGLFATTNLTTTQTILTSGLPAGFHVLYVRALDSDGVWGDLEPRPFYVSASDLTTQASIVNVEYFIDLDPGYGAATSIPVATATNVNFSSTIVTSALPAGFHVLYVRTLDSDGVWSELESRSFYVDGFAPGLLTGVEYFYDTDPGFGNGSIAPIAPPAASIDQVVPLSTATVTAGIHELGIRMLNDNGAVGMTEYYTINICDVAIANFVPDVVCVGSNTTFSETSTGILAGDVYSWDFDGDLVEDSNTAGNQSFTYTAGGTYNAALTIDRAGCINSIVVPVQVEAAAVSNAGADQAICTATATLAGNAPAANETGNWQLVTGTATITTPSDPLSTITGITTESVELSWTVTNAIGGCSVVDNVIISSSVLLNANFSATSVCIGSPTDFTDSSTGILGGDTYSWDFDGDATIDATTPGNQSFTYPSAGAYNATIAISRGACVSSTIVVVDVFDLPVITAGIDQSICTQSTALEGSTLGANETGVWQLISGTGTIANVNDPTSSIDNITTNTIELSWTVTNSVTTCVSVDNVIISVNLPITAAAENGMVDIGQSIIIDVLANVSSNSGDVLTSSIVSPPTFGTASILADNTINYTPNEDAGNNDTFTFRITNQCNNFDENIVDITITNQPPVIDNSSISVSANEQQVSLDLNSLISDPNNNIDFSSLRIVTQPISGALATIDASGILTIDYTGITFMGDDQLEIEICDLVGVCAVQTLIIPNIEVGGTNPPIKVFNAVSPNGDGYHDFLEIENIEFYPDNTVIILNRWGKEVTKIQSYNNLDNVFNSTTLPAGTYYYHVLPGIEDIETLTGFFLLKYE